MESSLNIWKTSSQLQFSSLSMQRVVYKQYERFLQCFADNSLMHMMDESYGATVSVFNHKSDEGVNVKRTAVTMRMQSFKSLENEEKQIVCSKTRGLII